MRLFRSWSACKDHAAAASAVAAAGPALGHERLAMERDTAFAAVPRPRVNFDFVNEHESWSSDFSLFRKVK